MRSWKFWLGIAVSVIFVWLTVRGLEWGVFWHALRGARYWWLAPSVAVYFVGVWARTWRWHYMLRHLKPISVAQLFPIVAIGYMGNNVYPARAGEVLRSYMLRKKEGIGISSSLGTVALERLFDGLVICTFVVISLPFVPLPALFRTIVIVCGVLFLAALGVILLLVIDPSRTEQRMGRAIGFVIPRRFHERVTQLVSTFLTGLHALRSPRDVVMIILVTVVIWLIETSTYWVLAFAFPALTVSWTTLMLMTAVVNLATMIPSAPGYVGTFDKPGIEVLKAFGQGANVAAAYTIVLHIALWLPITLVGLYFVARESATLNVQAAELNVATLERRKV